MKRYVKSGQYIPDLTERFPEGFNGRDLSEPRDPEDDFWDLVDRTEQPKRQDRKEWWVSFALQDGSQQMTYVDVPKRVDPYDYIESVLMEEYGYDFAEIADYGLVEEE